MSLDHPAQVKSLDAKGGAEGSEKPAGRLVAALRLSQRSALIGRMVNDLALATIPARLRAAGLDDRGLVVADLAQENPRRLPGARFDRPKDALARTGFGRLTDEGRPHSDSGLAQQMLGQPHQTAGDAKLRYGRRNLQQDDCGPDVGHEVSALRAR